MSDFKGQSTEQVAARLKAARRLDAIGRARDSLLAYTQFTMPDPEDIEDVALSQYETTPQGRLLCEIIEKVDRGELKRVAVSIGPQLGKSEVLSRRGPAWRIGRNPRLNIMLGSYNQTFANEFGDDVRTIMRMPQHQHVFPEAELRTGSQAKEYMVTTKGGKLAFVGVGASGTGKPADWFVVDDPIRNDEDAQSAAFRDKLWAWFNRVVFTRCHKGSAVTIVHTRWHEDDLIGRLCDPDHPERDKLYKGIAKHWTYINLPAVVDEPKLAKALGLTLEPPTNPDVISMFGTKPMSALWPERKSLEFLAEARLGDPKGFDSLYMGKPSPDDGEYFKAEWLVEYDREDLPQNLRKYGASDHAVSVKQDRDYTVLGCVGVDENDDIWVLPDVVWEQMQTPRTVEEILEQMRRHKPMLWWMESELISKSFGPFLHQRMKETRTYCAIDPVVPSKDKRTRARAIQGRMAMKKVRFPRFAPWWQDARMQLLKFDSATNDDFVDWISWIGLGLTKEISAEGEKPSNDNVVRVGSIAWVKAASDLRKRYEKRRKSAAGW